ncbi:MAG: hypothetical protein GX946_03270 [Oligosphaeraceae bacterium]|nr:hypothetical protein [Oligosphaeraceae bacterium]
MQEQRAYLDVKGRKLYFALYLPAQKKADCALLMAEPFGEEKRSCSRMLHRLAKKLQQENIAVLKFDFSGTGDSAGTAAIAEWRHWQEELDKALEFLQQQSQAKQLALLGLRAGALLAAELASRKNVDKLLLGEPILSGSELLVELEKRQKIKEAISGSPVSDPAEDSWRKGENVDFAGFEINPDFAAQLNQAELLAYLQKLNPATAVLLLRVSAVNKFPSAWLPCIEALERHPGSQALIVKDKPFWGQLEYYESDAVLQPMLEFLHGS